MLGGGDTRCFELQQSIWKEEAKPRIKVFHKQKNYVYLNFTKTFFLFFVTKTWAF